MTDTKMIIRVNPDLKQDFDWACSETDNTASLVFRNCMRDFVAKVMAEKASKVTIEKSSMDDAQFMYDPNDATEILNIKKKIFLCREFEKLHPEVPLNDYSEREKIKQDAYKIVQQESLPVQTRTDSFVNIMKAHFQRSAQNSLNPDNPSCINKHPGFPEYAKHYVKSVGLAKSFGDDVYEELVRRFPLDGLSQMGDTTSWPNTRRYD